MNFHDWIYERAPERWLDGVPLGNGKLGTMLWGDGSPLRINLDSYYAWEMRECLPPKKGYNYDEMRRAVEKKDQQALYVMLYPRNDPVIHNKQDPATIHPTRLPLPRLDVFGLPGNAGSLRPRDATWNAGCWQAFVHAERKLFVLEHNVPDLRAEVAYPGEIIPEKLLLWGYPELEFEEIEGINVCIQHVPDGGEIGIAWRLSDSLLLATVFSSRETENPVEDAVALLSTQQTYEEFHESHRQWWDTFWTRSSIDVPDPKYQSLYLAEMYKLGSSTRPDGQAITLQGLWTCDGVMPPWAGDYHLNFNVQMCYWPLYAANLLDLGKSYFNTFTPMLSRFKRNCEEFFGCEGGWAGCAIGPDGVRVYGYPPAEFSPANLAWLAHNYWLHYKYSLDRDFLRDEALPVLRAAWLLYDHLLERGEDGKLHLPVCYSPEYGGGEIHAWRKDTSYDAAWIRFLCQALVEIDEVLKRCDPDRSRYEIILADLYDYPGGNELWVAAGVPLTESHRHFSHLAPIFPAGTLSVEGTETECARIDKSLDTITRLGTGLWTGYSFPYMALIAGRCGKAEMVWSLLERYFPLVNPNTFHVNGDPRRFGTLVMDYEPMTIEGGFGFAAALQEMLLQSWGGIIRLFPATPAFWPDASFRNFLAEGAVTVSATRRGGLVRRVELTCQTNATIKLKAAFAPDVIIDGKGASQGSDTYWSVELKAGRMTVIRSAEEGEDVECSRDVPNRFGLKLAPRF